MVRLEKTLGDPSRDNVLFSYCIAIDPGVTTGLAIIKDPYSPWTIELAQLGPAPHHLELHRVLCEMRPLRIVCESFENRGQSAAVFAPVEYIGVIRMFCQMSKCEVYWQNAATGKAFWTDDKLRRAGLYLPGLKHARDATRHYAYWRTFHLKDQAMLMAHGLGQVKLLH
jgi:hypothetical protein